MEVSSAAVEPLWKAAFGEADRPKLYTSTIRDGNDFQPLNDPQNFISDINAMTSQQLYAASSNNQLAMKEAQDEYLFIDSLIAHMNGKEVRKSPPLLQEDQAFENRKESQLYSYKYEAHKPALINREADDVSEKEKHDVQLYQEPFEQGGFVPTAKRQYEIKKAKAKDPKNPDGWQPIEKDGKKLIPRQQVHFPEYTKAQLWSLDGNETLRPGTALSEDSQGLATPSKKAIDKRLTRTRFDGQKVPPTRDVSEAPSRVSTPRPGRQGTPRRSNFREMTPMAPGLDDSPQPKRRKVDLPLQQPARAKTEAGATTEPISPNNMRNRKWATVDLLKSIKEDHTWLHPDATKALQWKNSILAGQNPVRTWSMLKKWENWHVTGRDKRPRNRDGGRKDQIKKMGLNTSQLPRADGDIASPMTSRKNSAATIDTTGLTDGNPPKLRLKIGGDDMEDELQQQADQQLLHSQTESPMAEEDGDYKATQGDFGTSPSTPVRRSLRTLKGGT